jgi:hypothetical protein
VEEFKLLIDTFKKHELTPSNIADIVFEFVEEYENYLSHERVEDFKTELIPVIYPDIIKKIRGK